MAYCHEVWGRGGFEGLRDKTWQKLWTSEARPTLTEWEFAVYVVLPWVAHYAMHKGTDRLGKPAAFATRKAVTQYRRELAKIDDTCKKLFATAQLTAKRTGLPDTGTPPDPPPEVDAGRWEQPPRNPSPRLKRMEAKSGKPPYPVRSIGFRDLVVWAENVTDWMADRGEFPTVGCLVRWVGQADGVDDHDEAVLAARRIVALYYTEYEQELEQNRLLYQRATAPPPAPAA
jgi:hypothetical protein